MLSQKKIIKNSVKCNVCGDIIISESVNNKVACKCGNVQIAGSDQYLLREGNNYTELTQYFLNE